MPKVKICGLMRLCDADFVNAAGVDYTGFVFAKSRREISYTTAKEIRKRLLPSVKTVGVYVDERPERIINAVREKIIDIIQLHGNETEGYISSLKKSCSAPIIKAVKITDSFDISNWQNSSADFLLLDSGAGSGRTFDWSQISEIEKPWFLAGGICCENISEAISMNPHAVDVSSGAETNGIKDFDKIKYITEHAHKTRG